jgi:hypothetical protein
MLKLGAKCNVCKAIKDNKDLAKEIFNTTYYLKDNNHTLKDVYERHLDEGWSYDSLKNHVKRHQFMNETDYNKRAMQKIKQKHVTISREKTIESQDVWQEVINKGMDDIREGRVVVKPEALLKAAKDKSDYELKVNDQKLAYTEMMWHFASGENTESKSYDRRIIEGEAAEYYDVTQGPTGHPDEGEDGPSTVHQPPTWDALT